MQKIKLSFLDERINQMEALRIINSSSMSRKGLFCNFIIDGEYCYCLITLCDGERDALPVELKNTMISYEKLKLKALS